jgi:hypothetical protein
MANVKVFADRQTIRWTGQKLNAPDLLIQGHKKEGHWLTFTAYLTTNPCCRQDGIRKFTKKSKKKIIFSSLCKGVDIDIFMQRNLKS